MRTAVLSDIHGNLPALEAVVADALQQGCTGFVNLGDSLSGPLWPAETADYLMEKAWPTIAGNHERQLLTTRPERMNASDAFTHRYLEPRHRAWLAALPETLQLNDDVLLCHGTPSSDLIYFLHNVTTSGAVQPASDEDVALRAGDVDASLILCGHTHLPAIRRVGCRTVANPGSVGLPAYSDDHPVPHFVSSGSNAAAYAIVENATVELRSLPYDNEHSARQAERNGRPDWAHALRTGFALQ